MVVPPLWANAHLIRLMETVMKHMLYNDLLIVCCQSRSKLNNLWCVCVGVHMWVCMCGCVYVCVSGLGGFTW